MKLGRESEAEYADAFGAPADFLAWLRLRLTAAIPLLKPSALICLHVD